MRFTNLLVASLLFASPAFGAWANVGSIGSNNNKNASSSTVVFFSTATVEVNNVIIVWCSGNNLQTTDGNTTQFSVSDDRGNTYTRAAEFTNGQGAAAAGATVAVFFSKVTTQLEVNDAVTCTSSSTIESKALIGMEFTITSSNVVSVAGSTTQATDGANPANLTLSGLSSQAYLWIHGNAHEGANGETYTEDTDYTAASGTTVGTSGGGAATNMCVAGGYRIFTGTSDSVDIGWSNNRDEAQVFVALLESAPPDGGPSRLLMGVGK